MIKLTRSKSRKLESIENGTKSYLMKPEGYDKACISLGDSSQKLKVEHYSGMVMVMIDLPADEQVDRVLTQNAFKIEEL